MFNISEKVGKPAYNSKAGIFMPSPHYIRTGGFAPVWRVNAPTAFSGVEQRVSEITLFFLCPNCLTPKKLKPWNRGTK